MNFTKFTQLVSQLILIGLSVSIIACSQNTSTDDQSDASDDRPDVSDDRPDVSAALDPSQYFLIDFENKQITHLNSSNSHDVILQTIYQPEKAISYALEVGDKQPGTPGIYDIGVTLTNNTGQVIEDKYGGIRVIVTKFEALNVDDVFMPGGGIANARYMAESFRPFVFTTDFLALQGFISPGRSADVAYRISLPARATKALIGLLTLGSSTENNTIPGNTVSYLTPMIGKFKTEDLTSGPAHLTRMGKIQSLATCDGFVRFFDNTYDIMWTFSGDSTSWFQVEDFNGNILEDTNVYGMDCFGGDLFTEYVLALFDKNTLYVGDDILGTIIGTGDRGFVDDFQDKAQFNRPRDVAVLGHTIFVADSGNKAIRRVHVNDNENFFVDTVIQNLDSSPLSVTTDEIGNIYFLLSNGVYRIPLDTKRAIKILPRNIDEDSKLRWDGAAALVLAETGSNRIYRVAPTRKDLNAAWDVEVIAGDGTVGNPNPGGPATKLPVEKPIALSVDESGTLWYASLNANQISRIDRIRK